MPKKNPDEMEKSVDPNHYKQGSLEVWDAIIQLELCYLGGNVLKYLCRYRFKDSPIVDLHKARKYLDKLISKVEEEQHVEGG